MESLKLNGEQKVHRFESLKYFLKKKMDNSELCNVTSVCQLIDEFSDININNDKEMENTTTDSSSSPNIKKKKLSYYNYWMGNELKKLAETQRDVPDNQKISNRMSFISTKWAEYKKNDEYFLEKKEYDEKQIESK